MAEVLIDPRPKMCAHDLPSANGWPDCVLRCGICDGIYHSVDGDWGRYWKQRSQRWLDRRLRKLEHR